LNYPHRAFISHSGNKAGRNRDIAEPRGSSAVVGVGNANV
jgi:hypothetical protein